MSEILFRGKRTDNHEWVYGSLIDKDYILNYIDLAESWDACTSDHKVTCRAFEVLPETAGQYIGFNDNNGVKIFQGDIVSMDVLVAKEGAVIDHDDTPEFMEPPQDDWELGRVDWDHAGFVLFVKSDEGEMVTDIPHDTLVIGNIFDNPELLQP